MYKMDKKRIIIVCGEASGDLNAASLAKEIFKINPRIKISAVGGTLLKQAGAEIFYDIKGLSVIGLFDALKKLPRFFALQKLILRKIENEKPNAIILVDFSGFNLRLAKKIDNSLPVIYYTSPQVWASRTGRIKTIKKYISKMFVFFKFEEEFYNGFGVDTHYIGHPLLDSALPSSTKDEFLKKLGLSGNKITVALLPGSRKTEIKNILPAMLKSSALIAKKIPDLQLLIAKAPGVDQRIYEKIMGTVLFFNQNKQQKNRTVPIIALKIVDGLTCDCLNAADFSLVASGTATLEAAIIGKPFLVIYKMGLLNYLLYRPQVKLPFIGMVNIVAGKKIIPEFIQFQARPKKIAQEAIKILSNPGEITRIKTELAQVKSSLGNPGASLRASQIILNYLTP